MIGKKGIERAVQMESQMVDAKVSSTVDSKARHSVHCSAGWTVDKKVGPTEHSRDLRLVCLTADRMVGQTGEMMDS